jgi:hypothetical protein
MELLKYFIKKIWILIKELKKINKLEVNKIFLIL